MKRYVDLDEILLALPKSAAKIIEDWPLADVEEVRHGKWIPLSGNDIVDVMECSNCGMKYGHDKGTLDIYIEITRFCPNCGARMNRE